MNLDQGIGHLDNVDVRGHHSSHVQREVDAINPRHVPALEDCRPNAGTLLLIERHSAAGLTLAGAGFMLLRLIAIALIPLLGLTGPGITLLPVTILRLTLLVLFSPLTLRRLSLS